ncbi:NAD(P)-dependent oxidoreductase [Streptomyces sp. SP2-10]|uniref:NAD(P)-dependent oxidoreductase n=1 Tax=Streptomyces sp. SP2-10 TaxID=2873385 RepID=UPI001CA6F4B8|nr:NAD(P)H-binding protein [Streptomyces sp. SP2-10]MBY8839912.1 NAD(P)H-binding protein [Streptomyces sp. SP2-10]
MMTIVIFGAGGMTGSSAVAEAASRGHHVRPLRSADADITDPQAVARAAAGHDAAIAGVAPAEADPGDFFPAVADGLVTGLQKAGVSRLVWVSIASLLPDAAGVPPVDTGSFPAEYRPFSLGHRTALETFKASGLQWTAVSPAGDFATDTPAIGGYTLTEVGDLTTRITHADHARALVDLAERSGLRGAHLGVAPQSPGAAGSVAGRAEHR